MAVPSRLLPRTWRERLRWSRSGGSRRSPRLSVVVPVHNVEDYLPACLDSIAAQTYRQVEVVIVDDGSTDGSAAIAAAYADRHRHWTVIRTDNHGLGAARNRGVQHATGDYLAFVDSDDLVPRDAYTLMVSTLEQSGSDFVVGGVCQLIDGELVEPEFLRAGLAQRRIGVTASDVPAITRNVFAWNKVFRRSFFDRAGIVFPEGVRYEDQPATMRAYLLAERFDILQRPVYHWRVRAEGTSITQGRTELADLADRLATKAMVSRTVKELADPVVQEFWGRVGVVGDLPVYFAQIPHVDDAYWTRLVAGLRELLAEWPPIEDSGLRLPQRLVGWLVLQDRRADAERVLGWLADHPGPLTLQVEGDHVLATDLPVASDPASGLPDGVRHLGPHELTFDARLVDVRWDDETLVVTGWALIRGAPTRGVATDVRLQLRAADDTEASGRHPVAEVERFRTTEATRWIGRGNQVYDDSGFTARFDLGDWLAAPDAGRSELVVAIEVDVAKIHAAGPLRTTRDGVDVAAVRGPARARLEWRQGQGLVVVRRVR